MHNYDFISFLGQVVRVPYDLILHFLNFNLSYTGNFRFGDLLIIVLFIAILYKIFSALKGD